MTATSKPRKQAGAAEGTAQTSDRPAFVEHLLRRSATDQAPTGTLGEAVVASWSEAAGLLADGRSVRQSASCLLRPMAGDRVLVWRGAGGRHWVLAVLERSDEKNAAVLAVPGPVAVQAPRIALSARAVHIAAEDFLTSTRNHHSVEDTRTATSRVRVSQIGTDIRRVTTADEQVHGTLLQRAGTWISNTAREARLRARTFMFD